MDTLFFWKKKQKYFQHRHLRTLPAPVANEPDYKKLQDEGLESSVVKESFRAQINHIIAELRQPGAIPAKSYEGCEVNGSSLAALAQFFVKCYNEKGFPAVNSAWAHVCQEQLQRAEAQAIHEYETTWAQCRSSLGRPFAEDEVKQVHAECHEAALSLYASIALGEVNVEKFCIEKLDKKAKLLHDENNEEIRRLLKESLEKLATELSDNVTNNVYSKKGGLAEYDKAAESVVLLFREQESSVRFQTASALTVHEWIAACEKNRSAIRTTDDALNEEEKKQDMFNEEKARDLREMAKKQQQADDKLKEMAQAFDDQKRTFATELKRKEEAERARRREAEKLQQRRDEELRRLMEQKRKDEHDQFQAMVQQLQQSQEREREQVSQAIAEQQRTSRAALEKAQQNMQLAMQKQQENDRLYEQQMREMAARRQQKSNAMAGGLASLAMGLFPGAAPYIGAATTIASGGTVQPQPMANVPPIVTNTPGVQSGKPKKIVPEELVGDVTKATVVPYSTAAASGGASVRHVVAKGENLTAIARKYGTTVDALVRANNISNPNLIFLGQVLCVPE